MIDYVFFSLFLVMCVCYVGDVVSTVLYLHRKRPGRRQADRIVRVFIMFWIIAFLVLLMAYLWVQSLVHVFYDLINL